MKRKSTGRTSLFLTSYIIASIMMAGCHASSRQVAVPPPADSLLAPSTGTTHHSLPAVLIAPGTLKPYTLKREMMALPDSLQRNSFRMLNGVKANVAWAGIAPLEQGDFEYYTFSLSDKRDTLFRVDSVFKVWLPEVGGDWISIQLKKEVAESYTPGTLYLVNTRSRETFIVDQDIHHSTNAPVVKQGNVFYVFYIKDDKVYRYDIAEKKAAAIAVLAYQDLDSENVDPYKLELQQTDTGLNGSLVIQYNGKYYCIPFPVLP
ncbi:hypothetical protein [Chitinophaga varians]|uniref:hypothetical protein n=1 Tax=Chitinophaga varians TaxID=2202339 RepID=UPI00165FB6A9|nr:hypothetical protein [Chitinophaga varians]MBC9909867.1 hypothetical protein [Chitinophaga varians]